MTFDPSLNGTQRGFSSHPLPPCDPPSPKPASRTYTLRPDQLTLETGEPLASLRGSARLRCAKNHGAHSGTRLKKRFARKPDQDQNQEQPTPKLTRARDVSRVGEDAPVEKKTNHQTGHLPLPPYHIVN